MSEYRTKPSQQEPWRYVCPKCRNQVYRSAHSTRYMCYKCKHSYKKDELIDKKLS